MPTDLVLCLSRSEGNDSLWTNARFGAPFDIEFHNHGEASHFSLRDGSDLDGHLANGDCSRECDELDNQAAIAHELGLASASSLHPSSGHESDHDSDDFNEGARMSWSQARAPLESAAASCPQATMGPTVWHDFFAVDTRETPFVGDFNGDGKTDIITFTRDNPNAYGDVYAALSDGTKFGASTKWHDFFAINTSEEVVIGDYDGDGKDDIGTYLKTTSRQVYVATSTGNGMTQEALWLGDVDGDGRIDILTFATDSPTAFGDVYVALSDGSRFGDANNASKWHDFFAINPAEVIRIGDFSGDDKDDFFTFLPAPFHQVYTASSMGTSMGPNALYTFWLPPPGTADKFYPGDVNGDGRDDIV